MQWIVNAVDCQKGRDKKGRETPLIDEPEPIRGICCTSSRQLGI